MSDSGKKRSEANKRREREEKQKAVLSKCGAVFVMLPAVLTLAVVPIIMRYYIGLSSYHLFPWSTQEYNSDIFLVWKSYVYSAIAAVMLLLDIIAIAKLEKTERKKFFIRFSPMFAYLFFILLSTFNTYNLDASIYGESDQNEPVMVLLGYSLTAIYVVLHIKNEKQANIAWTAALVGGFLVGSIGVLQFLGFKPLHSEIAKFLMIPKEYREGASISGENESELVVSTLYNTNYVAPFVSVYLPICLGAVFKKSKIWMKLLGLVVAAELSVMLLGSDSKTGIIIIPIAFLISAIFMIRPLIKRFYITVPLVLVAVAGLVFYTTKIDASYIERLKTALDRHKIEYDLKGIDTTGDCAEIFYKDHDIKITFTANAKYGIMYGFEATDNGVSVPMTEDAEAGQQVIALSDGEEFRVTLLVANDVYPGFFFSGDGFEYTIIKDGDDYKVFNGLNRIDESFRATKILEGYETIATGRGYSWRTAINAIPKFIIYGAGPDCYPNGVFGDGNDVVAQKRSYHDTMVFTRPHNYFLQMAIETGLLSVIAVLVFIVWYIVDCFRLYFFKKATDPLYYAGIACMTAVIGFLGSGIANDSLIVITPQFWMIFGLGMAVNGMMREKQKTMFTNESENGKILTK